MSSDQDSHPGQNIPEKERMRATLAIGAIALAYYLKASFGITIRISTIPIGMENWFPQFKPVMMDATIGMVTLFGAYLLGLTIALSNDMIKDKHWGGLCELAQVFGRGSYLLGAFLLVAVYFFGMVALIVGLLTVVDKSIRFARSRAHHQKSLSPTNSLVEA